MTLLHTEPSYPSTVVKITRSHNFTERMLVEDDKITFRTVTIGDSSVGKTSIVGKFIRGTFNANEKNTIGALYDFFKVTRDGQEIEVQVWDTAGQEQYRSLSPVYFRSAAAAMIVFDITNRSSFENVSTWLNEFRNVCSDKAVILLLGNKVDLDISRKVELYEAKDFAEKNDCYYFETSAKTGAGIQEVFDQLVDLLIRENLGDAATRNYESESLLNLKGSEESNNCGC